MMSVWLSVVALIAAGGGDWQLFDQDDDPRTGYAIYRRTQQNSPLLEVRLEALVHAPVPAAVAAVRRLALEDRYAPQGSARQVLQRKPAASDNAPEEYVIYCLFSPPVVSARDITTRLTLAREPATQSFVWRWTVANELGPRPKDGVVRITKSDTTWSLSDAGDGRTLAQYQSVTDPGGLIPDWLTNRLASSTALEQLATIRKLAAEKR
jgi:hypothetical protein